MYWIAIGDIHESADNAARVPGIGEAEGVIVTGDLTNRGTVEAARAVYETIARANPKVHAQIGNMDTPQVTEFLESKGANIHRKAVELAPGLGLLGVGLSTPTPFNTPSEVKDDVLAGWLEEVREKGREFSTLVLACHTPPLDTGADDLGGGRHVGSEAVRAFVEKVQPAACITGHIHEAKSVDRIGTTLVINPGMLSGGGFVRLSWDGSILAAGLEYL